MRLFSQGVWVYNNRFSGALILNSGYEPLQIVNWQRAIVLWLQARVEVLEFHEEFVHSVSASFPIPSVIRLKTYIKPMKSSQVRFSRQNVFLRDKHTCQYCGKKSAEKFLTIDHVIPLSRGGRHDWINVVTACAKCNNKKGSQTPDEAHMPLSSKPHKPKWLPGREIANETKKMPMVWRNYLVGVG